MKPERSVVKNERGSTIVAALLILTLLTIIGIAAINSSTTERATSANYLLYERVFFSAEAGLEHAKAALQNQLSTQIALLAAGGTPRFNPMLSQGPHPATNYFPGHVGDPTAADWKNLSNSPPTLGTYALYLGSAIVNSPLEGYQYSIYLWDNNDDADPLVDSDGTIFMLAQAVGPKNSKCSIFTTLVADAVKDDLSGYNAQEGAGPGKGYSSLDKGGISDFTAQVGRSGGLALH
jgi:type IV pilus assembly protein PilX